MILAQSLSTVPDNHYGARMKHRMSPPLASLYFVGIIASAAPTAAIAGPTPTVPAFTADVPIHEIALKKVRVRQKPAVEIPAPDDRGFLKGTNIPRRTTAPSSN